MLDLRCLQNRWKASHLSSALKKIVYERQVVILLFLFGCMAGCSRTQPSVHQVVVPEGPPAFIVRVQSSYGDLQQVNVSVEEWLFNGSDEKQFEKKETPFDIPVAAGDFSIRLEAPQGKPNIKLQLLKGEYRMVGFVQSNCVQLWGNIDGESGVANCMDTLR